MDRQGCGLPFSHHPGDRVGNINSPRTSPYPRAGDFMLDLASHFFSPSTTPASAK
jgi:hypothetical protein